MLALVLLVLLPVASQVVAGLDLGCDNLCTLRGLALSCRLRIHWAKTNDYKNEQSACHIAHAHVLSECFAHCSGCTMAALGPGCADEATTTITNTTITTSTTTATTTTVTTTTVTTTSTKSTTTTQTSTTQTTTQTTTKTTTNTTTTTTKTTTTNAVTKTATATNTTHTKTSDTSTTRSATAATTRTSTHMTSGHHKRGSNASHASFKRGAAFANAANASTGMRHRKATTAISGSGSSSKQAGNSSGGGAGAATHEHHMSFIARGSSEVVADDATAKSTPGSSNRNDTANASTPSHNRVSETTKSRDTDVTDAKATASTLTSPNETKSGISKTKVANKKPTTETTVTPVLENFCCSAALDDNNYCGTCSENAPLMNDKHCRQTKESCEDCGHVWCNRTDSKGSCKAYGCIEFQPFNDCQCNPECAEYGSCCDDYSEVCSDSAAPVREMLDGFAADVAATNDMGNQTCAKLGCTNVYRPNLLCQCNDACDSHNSCCPDYWHQCTVAAKHVEEKHHVGPRLLTVPVGLLVMIIPSLALFALLAWVAARWGSLKYSSRSVVLPTEVDGSQEADSRAVLVKSADGEPTASSQ